jgi:hypothetical protein
MSDRHAGYIVTLKDDVRDDDAESIVTALEMVKGVLSVDPIVADVTLWLAEMRAKTAAKRQIIDMLTNWDSDD